ncbi:MAG: pantoate--beta-alanine ligase [Flavisolibacter sp.]
MIIFKQAKPLNHYLEQEQKAGKKIGFVPTMGALHQGHLSLVSAARTDNTLTVCSIFVNPTQFNNAEDFKHYPVTVEKDLEQLVKAGCDILFLPGVKEIYPPGQPKKTYDLGLLENILEGSYRPGHFQGVCQVVDRLLDIIHPDNLYMGQKDFQQCMVVKKLLELAGKGNRIRLNILPTVRENGGLAMSSRNLRLNTSEKKLALSIFEELSLIQKEFPHQSISSLKHLAEEHLREKGFSVDYVEIASARDLHAPVQPGEPAVALIAASIGKIRLIDNLVLN